MSIKLKQFDGSLIAPKDDAITYDLIIGQNGIISGCNLLFLGANKVRVAAGRGIIKGRIFVVEEEILSCQMTDAGIMPGRIYIRMDLADLENPIAINTITAETLPDLEQNDECNETNGVYEIELAAYMASEIAISDLTETYNTVKGLDVLDSMEEIEANIDGGRIAGALALKELKKSVADGKALIAAAVTNKGVATSPDDTFAIIAQKIGKMATITAYTQNFTINVQGNGFDKTYTYPINRTYKSAWVGITNLPSKLIGYSPQQGASAGLNIYISGNNVCIRATGNYHTSSSNNSGVSYSGTFLVVLSS